MNSASQAQGLPVIDVDIKFCSKCIRISALLDTGSSLNLIKRKYVDAAENISRCERFIIKGGDGKVLDRISEKINPNIIFPSLDIEVPECKLFLTNANINFECILGYPLIKLLDINFSKITMQMNPLEINEIKIIQEHDTFMCSTNRPKLKNEITNKNLVIIGPGESFSIHVNEAPLEEVIIDRTEDMKICQIQFDVLNGHSRILHGINEGRHTVIIEKDTVLGEKNNNHRIITSLNTLIMANQLSPPELEIHNEEYKEWKRKRDILTKNNNLMKIIQQKMLEADVEVNTRIALTNIAQKYDKVFARSDNDVGFNKNYVMKFKFKNNMENKKPESRRAYRFPNNEEKDIMQFLDELVETGVLENSNSSWTSPSMIIKKKNLKYRLVTNFRLWLNPLLSVPQWPIRPIRSIFHSIGEHIRDLKTALPGSPIKFITVDLKSGYFTLNIAPDDRKFTAFPTPKKLLQYKKVSQGLSIAPAVFSQFIAEIYEGPKRFHNAFRIETYLDDCILVATEKTIPLALEWLLKTTYDNDIILDIQKCSFGTNKVEFLGYNLNEIGLRPIKSKYEALEKLQIPRTQRELQQFLGAVQFYVRVIPRAMQTLKPLTIEISNKTFKGSSKVEEAVMKLRKILKSSKELFHPLPSQGENYILAVDSSLTGYGSLFGLAKIHEDQAEDIKAIAYGSGHFDKRLQLDSSRNRELCGLEKSLTYFKDLIDVTKPLYAFVDHKSLATLETNEIAKKEPVTRVRKALATIMTMPNLIIKYVSAKSDLIRAVDGISRTISETQEVGQTYVTDWAETVLPQQLNNIQVLRNKKSEHPSIISFDENDIMKAQKSDGYCSDLLRKSDGKILWDVGSNSFEKKDEIIYKFNKAGNSEVILPTKLAYETLVIYHYSNAHCDKKLLAKLISKNNCYVHRMQKIIKDIKSDCFICQMRKRRVPQKSHRKNIPSIRPMQEMCVDIIVLRKNSLTPYCFTITDKFSEIFDAVPIQDKTSYSVRKAMMICIFKFNLGIGTKVLSDNGSEFRSEIFRNLLKTHHITHSFITPLNASSNPVERIHKNFRKHLLTTQKLSEEELMTDYEHLQLAIASYNNKPKSNLNWVSPTQILTNITPHNILSFGYNTDLENNYTNLNEDEQAEARKIWNRTLMNYHTEIGNDKYIRYIKDQGTINKDEIKESDVVVVQDYSPLGHGQKTTGPYFVRSNRRGKCKLEDLLTGQILDRNEKLLRKIILNEDVRIKLRKTGLMRDEYGIPIPIKDVTEIKTDDEDDDEDEVGEEPLEQHIPENKMNQEEASGLKKSSEHEVPEKGIGPPKTYLEQTDQEIAEDKRNNETQKESEDSDEPKRITTESKRSSETKTDNNDLLKIIDVINKKGNTKPPPSRSQPRRSKRTKKIVSYKM